jgi:hypothetical protein
VTTGIDITTSAAYLPQQQQGEQGHSHPQSAHLAGETFVVARLEFQQLAMDRLEFFDFGLYFPEPALDQRLGMPAGTLAAIAEVE